MSSEYSDNWQLEKFSLIDRQKFALRNHVLSDCSFQVGTKENRQIFHCHRVILAIASPVFQDMLYAANISEDKNPIHLFDVEPDAFKEMIEFVYTDHVTFSSVQMACHLLLAARKFQLPQLVIKCLDFLWKKTQADNVWLVHDLVSNLEEPQLVQHCIQIIQEETKAVLSQPNALDINIKQLLLLVEQDALNVPEKSLINFCEQWAKHQAKRFRTDDEITPERHALGPAFNLLRFLTLTPSQFAAGTALSSLLTKQESFSIILNLASPKTVDLPLTISSNSQKRKIPKITKSSSLAAFRKCDRTISNREMFEPSRNQTCGVYMQTDHMIWVMGLQIPTQSYKDKPKSNNDLHTNKEKTYSENISVVLEEYYSNGQREVKARENFKGTVDFVDYLNIKLQKPVLLDKRSKLCISVGLNASRGSYKIGDAAAHVANSGVNFTFKPIKSTSLKTDAIIKSIYYIIC